MSALPAVAFHATEAACGVVTVILPHPIGMNGFGPIVRSKQNQRIVADTKVIDGIEKSAGQDIELVDEIAPGTCIRFAVELRSRQYGRMRNLSGEHDEEWIIGKVLSMLGDELQSLVTKQQISVDKTIVR